jgi:hypothetical protein
MKLISEQNINRLTLSNDKDKTLSFNVHKTVSSNIVLVEY